MDVAPKEGIVTNIDDVLIKFKIFGRYYGKCLLFLIFSLASACINANNFVFIAMEDRYRCADERFGNDSCASLSNSTDVCTEWVYEDPHSFVAEFQLACQEWKRTSIGSIHSFGTMTGLIIVGPVSDWIGRNKTIAIFGTLCAIMGIAKSFVTYYWIFIVLEFIEAVVGTFSSPVFMLSVELVAHERRLLFSMIIEFGYAMGFLLLPLAAWCISYWRYLLLVLYSLPLLCILYIFLMDESPRWLLSKGNKVEAVAILQKMAKSNKIKLDTNDLQNLSNDSEVVDTIKFVQLLKDTFVSKVLLKRFFICVIWWTACTFVNYGLQINSVSLPGNKYVNFSYFCLIEVLANIMLIYFFMRFRRKLPLTYVFFLAALLCTLQTFIPNDLPWLSILFFMGGKLMAAMFFGMTYLFTSELFPTYTRNSMHAFCSSVGRIGSIIAPQTPLLMPYWKGLPSLICGIVSLAAGLVTLLAPDTADETLPDTVLQAESLGQNKSQPKIKNYEHKF